MKVKDKTRVIQVEVKGKTSGSQGQNKDNSRVNQVEAREINGKQGKSRENQILMKKVHKKQAGIKGNRKGNRTGNQNEPEEIDRRKAN